MSEAIVLPLAVPQTVSSIRRELARLDEAAVRGAFDVPFTARLLKTTISLCADCLGHVPAAVFAADGRVLMHKRCERHGASLVSTSRRRFDGHHRAHENVIRHLS